MTVSSTENKFVQVRDIIGQLPLLSTYAQLCLLFEVSDQALIPNKLNNIRAGLARLADSFPWLSGQVVVDGRTAQDSGTVRLVTSNTPIPLVVKDLSNDVKTPNMPTMKEANFPFHMLDASVIASQVAFAETFKGVNPNEGRALVIDATIIQGGLLLNFAGQHHFMDMNGLGQVIRLLAKACRNEPFSDIEIKEGNCSRMELIPPFDDRYEPGPELDSFIIKSVSHATATGDTKPSVSWVYFTFNSTACKRLKDEAADQKIAPYITTNDAVSAFIWKSVMKVRTHRRGKPFRSEWSRAVDGRRALGLSSHYLGHAVIITDQDEADITQTPLGDIAGKSRLLLNHDRLNHVMRALVTVLARTPDKTMFGYGANFNPDTDLILSSWTGVPCMECDFGQPLGMPVAARRPRFSDAEGLVYLMPKSRDGDIAAAMCLRDDDTQALRNDSDFTSYAVYVG